MPASEVEAPIINSPYEESAAHWKIHEHESAEKMGRDKHPPGRDVRYIVSVGMLTEGWDCNTVTHIIGLRHSLPAQWRVSRLHA